MTEAPVRVLYVAGVPRSGSTLTDLMLHQLPGHVGVGELFYLWRNGVIHDGLCACGAPFHGCPFWKDVGDRAFGGWRTDFAEEMMRLQEVVDTTSAIPRLLAPRRPRRFQAELDSYADVLRQLYRAILDVSGAEVIVDSSKRPSLAFVLRAMPDIDLRVAHVVRDPRGVAYSFAKHVALPEGAALRGEMPRSSTRKVARRWVTVNTLVDVLARLGVPSQRLRYEDLVRAPERELGTVMRLTGMTGDATSLDFVHDGSVEIPQTHLVAAGRIRLQHGAMPLKLDEAWREDMPTRSRRLVSVMTAPVRARYGYLG